MFFNKNDVTVNDNTYKFRANNGVFELPLTVKAKLSNIGPDANVDVVYDLYSWDDSSTTNLLNERKESFSLSQNDSHTLTYEIPDSKNQVYQLSITAFSDDGRKAVLKLRFPMDTQKGRFIFLGIDKFPIKTNDLEQIMWCYSNSAYSLYQGRQTLEVQDAKGNVVKSFDYRNVNISGPVDGASTQFSSNQSMNYVKIVGKIYDSNNTLQQQVQVVYDAAKFGIQIPQSSFNYFYLTVIVGIVVVAVLAIVYWKRR